LHTKSKLKHEKNADSAEGFKILLDTEIWK